MVIYREQSECETEFPLKNALCFQRVCSIDLLLLLLLFSPFLHECVIFVCFQATVIWHRKRRKAKSWPWCTRCSGCRWCCCAYPIWGPCWPAPSSSRIRTRAVRPNGNRVSGKNINIYIIRPLARVRRGVAAGAYYYRTAEVGNPRDSLILW